MYIQVRVTAGARKELFVPKSDTLFSASVREKAERNQANTRIVELVAAHFLVSTKQIRIVNGHRSASKLLSVETD